MGGWFNVQDELSSGVFSADSHSVQVAYVLPVHCRQRYFTSARQRALEAVV